MADIRINALATTAASTASDDFIAVDGSANGTRKLNAYSPTFGGNLTVSGAGQNNFTGPLYSTAMRVASSSSADFSAGTAVINAGSDTVPSLAFGGTNYGWGFIERSTDGNFVFARRSGSSTNTSVITLERATGNATLAGNLTVSGTGTSSFSGDVSILSNSKALFLGASSDVKLVRGGSGAGTLQLSAASDGYAEMSLRGAAGSLRITSVMTGANFRWYWGANTTAESGSNTGSDFVLVAGTDIGTTLGTAITVNRATLATTLGGNLTVSGTGTSSVGGKLQSIVPSATGYNLLYDTSGITTGRGAFNITSTGAGLALGIEASVGGTSFTNSTAYSSYFGTTTATPIHLITNSTISATITSGGNLLVGTTTDGGQKLQVNGNSGFLGHLEIPADKHIYMKQSNPLRWSSDGLSTGSVRADVYADSGGALYLRTNGSNTALTLDSSQRCILSGALRLANTYVATPQVSTGYVTIQDSTGTTYKVLVAT